MRARPAIDVTMLIPGLLGPGGGSSDPDTAHALLDGLDLRALDRLLARAVHAVEPAADGSIEALAFRMFGHEAHPAVGGGPDVPCAGTSSHPAVGGGPATGGIPHAPGADWPVAAVTALVDCDASIDVCGTGTWLRADPVHLRPDVADLVLFDAVDVGVSREEARALAEAVNEALRPGGPVIDAAHPHRWYVALEAPARMATTPLSLAAGAGISAAMPRGPDAPRWRRWMNEVQMALHDCPVNAERERRGAVPINSIWFWGGGSLPPAVGAPVAGGTPASARTRRSPNTWIPACAGMTKAGGTSASSQNAPFPGRGGSPPATARVPAPGEGGSLPPASRAPASQEGRSLPPLSGAPTPFVQACSDDALVQGLAHHAGIECGALPGDGASSGDGASLGDAVSWLDSAPRPGAHLIAFDALYRAARRSDLDVWRAGLVRFSASWAKPLLDALDRGAVARISIRDERGHRFTATRWGRFRWRRRGGLAATIAAAARHVR